MTESAKVWNILHIGKYFPPYSGGMETYLRDLMTAQARQGLETAALVHQSQLSLRSCDEEYHSGTIRLAIFRVAVWARVLFTPISPTFPWHLSRALNRLEPDILHIHLPNVSAFWVLFLASARRIPWVIHWHSDVLASESIKGLQLFYRFYRPFETALLRRCRQIIATSPEYLESSEPLCDFKEKCRVVPLGLETERLPVRPTSEALNAKPALKVLAVGRLAYYKGFDYLIRAASLVEDVQIDIVGTGELNDELEKLAKNSPASSRVNFHGNLTDWELAKRYSECDCLCLPSIERTEAFGMVLLEAMSHGKATIVSRVPGSGMCWVVDDGETGIHVPPADVEALAGVFVQLATSHGKLDFLGERGREKFSRMFHIDRSAAGIFEIYENVCLP